MRRLMIAISLLLPAGLGSAQELVDRGVTDIDPSAASLRVLSPGLGQFSTDGALIDRYAVPGALDHRQSFYNDGRVSQRYLFQTPGVAAVFNRSDYLTPDGLGDIRLNVTNANAGRPGFPVIPADTVFVLTPELLTPSAPGGLLIPDDPNFVDNRVNRSQYGPLAPDSRIDARYQPQAQPLLDLQAINQQHQRDPILVERSRLLREERAAEAEAARAQAIEDETDEAPAEEDMSDEATDDTPSGDEPAPAEPECE